LPIYQWTIGNYFLLHGNVQEAFRYLRVLLAGSRKYNRTGFGWKTQDPPEVYAGLDTATFHSPGHSLSAQITGNQNLNYHDVFKFVKVSPNRDYQPDARPSALRDGINSAPGSPKFSTGEENPSGNRCQK
jgi:hypothetical protein